MATGPFTWFYNAKPKATNGTIVLSSHVFKAMLVNGNTVLSPTYTGASGNCQKSDIAANEITGSGYAAGGTTVNLTWTANGTTGVVTINGSAAVWNNSTLTAVYLALYDATATNNDLVGYVALDTSLSPQSDVAGLFQVTFTGGVLTY